MSAFCDVGKRKTVIGSPPGTGLRAKKSIIQRKRVIIMASKSKKIIALLMTAMMAATAMAGCTGGGDDEEGGASAAPVVQPSQQAMQKLSLDSEEDVTTIKNKMAEEAAANGGTITLRMWCASDDKQFETSLVDEFKTKFADSRYTFNITTVVKGEDQAGGKVVEAPTKAADVFSFADDQLSDLLQAGAIAKVSGVYAADIKENNSEDAIGVSSSGGELYAYPKTSDNGFFMYYDKTIFSDDDVKDMDTMIAKAQAAGKSVYFNMGNAWYNTGFFFTAGCTIKFENGKQTATFGTPEGLSAAKAMCHIAENVDKGFIGTPGTMGDNAFVSQGFAEGKLAAAVIGTWMGPDIKKSLGKDNVGAAKLPTVLMDGQQKQLDAFGGYKLVGVNVNSKCSFSAQTLAYYLTCEASQIKRYETRGLIPTNTKAAANDEIKSDPAFKAIADQKEGGHSHAQGQSVGAKYWGAGVDSVGSQIVTSKGTLPDSKLEELLKGAQQNAEEGS